MATQAQIGDMLETGRAFAEAYADFWTPAEVSQANPIVQGVEARQATLLGQLRSSEGLRRSVS